MQALLCQQSCLESDGREAIEGVMDQKVPDARVDAPSERPGVETAGASRLRAPAAASEMPPRTKPSNYPAPFAQRMSGRTKRPLGDAFGLSNFGVNLTTLSPGAVSALQHIHSKQDEFVYVVSGELTLVSGADLHVMTAGMCVGFPAAGTSHHLENRSPREATFLEVGDRSEGDEVSYPADDITAVRDRSGWRFMHKNGEPY
nr:cupin domain-containing protein [Novosphingobium panipatense]